MKILKLFLSALVIGALMAATVCGCLTTYRQNTSGGYSSLSTVTEKSSQWIMDSFGHCRSVEELLEELSLFARENFVYQDRNYGLLQDFQMDTFVFEEDFHGVCHDFSCFAKCVVLVWGQERQVDVQVYVYDLLTRTRARHSYNYVVADGRTWFMDLTTDVTRAKNGKEPLGPDEITGVSIPDYMASYDEIKLNTH